VADHLDPIRAELAAAKANLAPTARGRTERGKAVKAAISPKRLRATGRDAVFSVRCRGDIPDAIRKLAEAQGLKIAEWFESLIDAEIEKAKK
jgi:hypothetical protein